MFLSFANYKPDNVDHVELSMLAKCMAGNKNPLLRKYTLWSWSYNFPSPDNTLLNLTS